MTVEIGLTGSLVGTQGTRVRLFPGVSPDVSLEDVLMG